MKHSVLFFVYLSVCACFVPAGDVSPEQVQQAVKNISAHPRLLWPAEAEKQVRLRVQNDPVAKNIYKCILSEADSILTEKPIERIKIGRRLLDKSRRCLDRVMCLSFVYRITGDKKYLKRAEKEMLAAAEFEDWNPSHFLDVAEMTAALAIGYDWLYDSLPECSRDIIREAIVEKGLKPSMQGRHFWIAGANNWNQVCNGGMTTGALAVFESCPQEAVQIIHRALNGVQAEMNQYLPDGAYPEGPGYWSYGTGYNVLMLAALDSALKTDFGLSSLDGFSKTGDYFLQMTGPTGLFFNYADCGRRSGTYPELFWLAARCNRPDWLWNEMPYLAKFRMPDSGVYDDGGRRFFPLLLIWANSFDTPAQPKTLCWKGDGANPVAVLRTGWDKNAAYIAVKGGCPSSSHAHMDAGSFVYDADGVRWAADLGNQNYDRVEQMGVSLFNMKQDSQRWQLMRYTNLWHNTLAVDEQLQRVDGFVPIVRFAADSNEPQVVLDLGSVYAGQLDSALRSVWMDKSGTVWIQDRLKAADKACTVRWSMVTTAKLSIQENGIAVLEKDKKKLLFSARYLNDKKEGIPLKVWPAEPKSKLDEPNPDTWILGFEISLQPHQQIDYVVSMIPWDGVAVPKPKDPPAGIGSL